MDDLQLPPDPAAQPVVADDSAPPSRTGGPVPVPLKRGSACQYCRRRKLKCSGKTAEGSCEGCIKTARECVFDEPAKPKTKMKRLEDKIADLEAMLSGQTSQPAAPPIPAAPPGPSTSQAGRRPSHVVSANGSSGAEASGSSAASLAYHPYLHPSHQQAPSRRQVLEQQSFSTALEELFSSEPHAGVEPAWNIGSPLPAGGDLFSWPAEDSWPAHGFASFEGLQQQSPMQSLGDSRHEGGAGTPDGYTSASAPTISDGRQATIGGWPEPTYLTHGQYPSYPIPPSIPAPPLPQAGPPPPAMAAYPAHVAQSAPSRTTVSPSTSSNIDSFLHASTPSQPPQLPNSFLSEFQSSASLPHLYTAGGRLEVPRDIRDALLALFWMRRRQFGCVLHPRFFERLDLTPEQGAPHPALVFVMMTCASQFSANQAVRSLEPELFEESRRLIEKGLEDEDRLLNLIQASTILAIFFYSQGRYREGWAQSGVSMRLAVGSQLHRIRPPFLGAGADWANYKQRRPQERGGGARRRVPSLLPPPTDMVDVGERIWAFWLACISDRTVGTADCWPAALSDNEIETPLPRPILEYVEGYDGLRDSTIHDLYQMPTPDRPLRRPDALGGCIAASLLLLHRASRLFDRPLDPEDAARPGFVSLFTTPEADVPPATTTSPSTSSSVSPGQQPPRLGTSILSVPPVDDPPRRVPPDCLALERNLQHFVSSIPIQYRDPGRKVAGGIPPWHEETHRPHDLGDWEVERPGEPGERIGINPVVILLHTQIYIAFALLYEEQARYDAALWPKSVAAAKSVVHLIQLIANVDFAKLDIFLVVCWRFASSTLLAEAKRQRKAGNDEASTSATVEVEVLVLAMQRIGQVFAIGDSHANFVKNVQTLGLDDDDEPDEASFGKAGETSVGDLRFYWQRGPGEGA